MCNYLNPSVSDADLCACSTLSLAHVGDGVFELMARTYIACHGGITSAALHRRTVEMVRASAQAKDVAALLPFLTDEERAVFIRGRNSKPKTIPKGASHADYASATGLEALFGWLYLKGSAARLCELFDRIVEYRSLQ